ncbi:GTP-binding protein [Streptomyces sp. NPDC048277]|uniref:GTP-binding protein n=1 Tax=Streptomyces sp. NPDC048277 TaxID=3155027 RepID=UPI0033D9CD8B
MHSTHLLNLGILAHVDAGKTSLTERLLHTAGVTDELGSVDDGSTRTDTLALERQRGITIKSAVVSFPLDGVTVNLIDTPGHPDFIAEVERVLGVLDGAVLVVSAVEGVQAQTRVLMRTLRRLGIPTLIFVNKIDRRGAQDEAVLAQLARRLAVPLVPMGRAAAPGTRAARFVPGLGPAALDTLADHDDALLAAYLDGGVPDGRLRAALADQTRRAVVHPVYFGSAITGAGVPELITGLERLLPAADGDSDGPLSARVFKVERGPAGEKIAYARLFSGSLRVRDRIPVGDGGHEADRAAESREGGRPQGARGQDRSAGDGAAGRDVGACESGRAASAPGGRDRAVGGGGWGPDVAARADGRVPGVGGRDRVAGDGAVGRGVGAPGEGRVPGPAGRDRAVGGGGWGPDVAARADGRVPGGGGRDRVAGDGAVGRGVGAPGEGRVPGPGGRDRAVGGGGWGPDVAARADGRVPGGGGRDRVAGDGAVGRGVGAPGEGRVPGSAGQDRVVGDGEGGRAVAARMEGRVPGVGGRDRAAGDAWGCVGAVREDGRAVGPCEGDRLVCVGEGSRAVEGRDETRAADRRAGGRRPEGRVTALSVFERGTDLPRDSAGAGRIVKVWGLDGIRIGDALGLPGWVYEHHFAPPSLETVVVPGPGTGRRSLHLALTQLAEQDPLIDVRHDEVRQETSVSLYGEVQKEVIQATLADEYGLDVTFRETTTICVERVTGTGAAVEFNKKDGNPFLATVGLRVEPAPAGAGVGFRMEVELGSMPYAFFKAVEDTVRETLGQGLHGWRIPDCTVTMTHSGYSPRQSHAHQRFDKSMSSTGHDFRGLTPLVLVEALRRAGTRVHEPMHRFRLEAPADTLGALLPVLARLGAVPRRTGTQGPLAVLEGAVPAARVHELEQRLPGLTRGEGELESAFDHHAPVSRGAVPDRARTDHNPLNRREYLLKVTGRVGG